MISRMLAFFCKNNSLAKPWGATVAYAICLRYNISKLNVNHFFSFRASVSR